SILHKHQLHLKPVINYWIEELKIALQTQFKQLAFPEKEFKFISTLDVDNLYAYKNKGLTRTAGALVKDFLRFDFKNLTRRISVITGKQADPFDVYEELTDFCNQEKTTLIYFFLQRSNTKYDRTIDPNSSSFKKIFAQFKNQRVLFGLHPSYHTYNNKHLLKKELELINSNSKSNINISRQHYLRYDIKITPSLLKETGIIADFSMGFASGSGYRAGTFTPFSYYNFTAEAAQELLMVPFVAMDGAYFVYSKTEAQVAENQLTSLAAEAKKLKGVFISVFHERTFDNELYPGFKQVYFNHIIKVKQ
ncbi:MAG: hypothetical protein JNM96_08535, partial [Bacteroidia bacterium]|nr:hypothetical protein [Bacteroidia bacterium]